MTTAEISSRIRSALEAGEPVRLDLESRQAGVANGRVFIDHAVPVLAVHRGLCRESRQAGAANGSAAEAACEQAHHLVTTQPAYVWTSTTDQDAASELVETVARELRRAAGALLVAEVWTPLDDSRASDVDPFGRAPRFTIYTREPLRTGALDELCDGLSGIEIAGQGADVDHVETTSIAPPGLLPLEVDATVVGLAVDAVFVNARDDEFYPRVLDTLRTAIAAPLAHTAALEADQPVASLGRTVLEDTADVVDQGLAEVASSFGFLLQVTPINATEAWDEFNAAGCDCEPEFLYRPIAFDPDAARRTLFALPLEDVEDPTVHGLLRECRDEIEAHIRMVLDIETPQFLPTSLRVYGAPDPELVALAHDIVAVLDERPRSKRGKEKVGATAFAAAARAQLEAYRTRSEHVPVEVEIRDDMPGSLMVSRGKLLVGAKMSLSANRVEALLAHEVGTHVLTYANGCAQPLRQLRLGMAGYQDLQEGIAVLSEWLVGGLTAGRFRTLAARVVGADALANGADFLELYRVIRETGLSERSSFKVALRLRRGGGLTKDMVYLRGLRDLLGYLEDGGDFWPLFVGKIALRHVPAIDDLHARGVLEDAPLRPLLADDPAALTRLDRARAGLSVLDLLSD